jgi:heme oxygenase (mycobilin-producing)
MAVVVTAEFFFKLDLINDALSLLAEVLPDTRGFEECETLETVIDLDDPGHVMVLERWTARDAHVAYLAWRVDSGSAIGLVDMTAAPPVIRYFEPRPDI